VTFTRIHNRKKIPQLHCLGLLFASADR